MSSDLLLLFVNAERRQLLLEGDCDLYQIPAASILSVEPQCFTKSEGQKLIWVVRLLVRVETGIRELLLQVGNTSFRPQNNRRRLAVTEQLCHEIQALLHNPASPATTRSR